MKFKIHLFIKKEIRIILHETTDKGTRKIKNKEKENY